MKYRGKTGNSAEERTNQHFDNWKRKDHEKLLPISDDTTHYRVSLHYKMNDYFNYVLVIGMLGVQLQINHES